MSTFDIEVYDAPLTVLVFGAHIDDYEVTFGRTGVKYIQQGRDVTFISMTNGEAGHHEIDGPELTRRRRAEARAAADVRGVECEFLDIYEGELMPSIENRSTVTP